MRRIYLPIITIALLACTTMMAWAVVPPPPVNQNIGLPDTQFIKLFDVNNRGTDTCKRCHRPDYLDRDLPQPTGIPALKAMYLPDRHHQHIGIARGGLIAGGPEQPPFPDADRDGVADTHYQCLNCHNILPGAGTINGGIEENHRDCFNCHIVTDEPNNQGNPRTDRTVHHDTPKAFNAECGKCHGWLIRSLDTGRPAPNWTPSIITPWKSGKEDQDLSITSSAGTHPGNCNFCHNTADGNLTGTDDDTSSFSNGFGAIKIFTNAQNHHATGIPTLTAAESPVLAASGEQPCQWCHFMNWPEGFTPHEGETIASWNIRGCQRCHDIPSLHSIEADVDGDGIVPGGEDPYNGHIGAQDNCWGCHGFDESAVVVQSLSGGYPVGATVPQLDAINADHWPTGTGFDLTLAGGGFENNGQVLITDAEAGVQYYQDRYFTPSVQLTDDNGNVVVLEPSTSDKTQIVVAIPADLAAGNYEIQVKKDEVLSNPLGVTVVPSVNVPEGAAICLSQYKVVILRGTGFSMYEPTAGSDVTGIIGDGVDATRIFVWKGGMIAARFNAGCPSTVEVNTVFDSVTVRPEVW